VKKIFLKLRKESSGSLGKKLLEAEERIFRKLRFETFEKLRQDIFKGKMKNLRAAEERILPKLREESS
jgi:hypothetical protein